MNSTPQNIRIMAVCGGSGSGKSTLSRALADEFTAEVIPHDAYYRDLSHLELSERAEFNFDSPDALESELLIEHLFSLRGGQAVDIPTYDFAAHTRNDTTHRVEPTAVVIVEGILVLSIPELRELFDFSLFVDAPAHLRFQRRLSRDIAERGRTAQQIRGQWEKSVELMFEQYGSPAKKFADLIIDGTRPVEAALRLVQALVCSKLNVRISRTKRNPS